MSTPLSRFISLSLFLLLLISFPFGSHARLSRRTRTKDHHGLASKRSPDHSGTSLWTPTSLTSKYLLSRATVTDEQAVQARAHAKPTPLTSLTRQYFEKRSAQDGCPILVVTPPGFQGQCDVAHPCPNGACCGPNNYCGYDPVLNCGTGCTSNCDATAECGQFASPPGKQCPLNTCCSKYGFCGITAEFCDAAQGCQSNCNVPGIPTGAGSKVTGRVVGYYEGWAVSRPCYAWFPQNIPPAGYTHLNFAFASIDPNSFAVVPADSRDVDLYPGFTGLKQKQPGLKTFISIGGWAFNDPPAPGSGAPDTRYTFSNIANDAGAANAFAQSLANFMIQYGFDGADIDWEYPVACERGGIPSDREGFVNMMRIVRSVLSSYPQSFGLTFTAPSSYWYLEHFDLPGLLQSADWVNLMSYDLHGTWDEKDVFIGNIVQAHTNLTEIKQSLGLFARAGVPFNRIVLGLGFYGRSFELADPSCTNTGCPFSGPAPAGPCTAADGTLAFFEVEQIIQRTGAVPIHDTDAEVKILVYQSDQDTQPRSWVSYDDADTLKAKVDFASGAGLGGLMVWSVDQDDFNSTALAGVLGLAPGQIPSPINDNGMDGPSCILSNCGQYCPSGYTQMTDVTDGKLADPTSYCGNTGTGRAVCCPSNHLPKSCQWRGCDGTCNPGEITLAVDTTAGGWKCPSGEHKAFCCDIGLTQAQIDNAQNCKWYGTYANNWSVSRSPACLTELSPSDTAIDFARLSLGSNDNVCPDGTFTKDTTHYYLNAACIEQQFSLCCDIPGLTTFPYAGEIADLFESPPANGHIMQWAQEDPIDENVHATPGNLDSEAFGFFAIDGDADVVTNLGNWVVSGCSDEHEQTVTAFCSALKDSQDCKAPFIGGAGDTIARLPDACGQAHYVRITALEETPGMPVPDHIAHLLPEGNPVYNLSWDYAFNRIGEINDRSTSTAVMRGDASNLPGYWNEMDAASPSRRGGVRRRDIEPRWFGSFTTWVQRLTTVSSQTSADLSMTKAFSSNLYSASQQCSSSDGSTQYSASLSIDVHGSFNAKTQFGFYVQAHVLPSPSIDKAYVYLEAGANCQLGFDITGKAQVSSTSGQIPLIPQIAWPGLSVKGLITVGPTLDIFATLSAALSLSGTYSIQTSYDFGSFHIALGDSGGGGTDSWDELITANADPARGWQIKPTADVQFSGNLGVHIKPIIGLGVDVLNGELSGRAFLSFDSRKITSLLQLYPQVVDLALTADLSSATVDVSSQIRGTYGVTGHVLGGDFSLTETEAIRLGPWTLYHQSIPIGGTSTATSAGGLYAVLPQATGKPELAGAAYLSPITANQSIAASSQLQANPHPLNKRGLFNGQFSCPKTTASSSAGDCAALFTPDFDVSSDTDDTTDENTPLRMRRSLPSVTLTASGNQTAGAHLPDVVSHVVIKGCPKTVTPAISPPFYQNTVTTNLVFDFTNPFDIADMTATAYFQDLPTGKYAFEHVFEMQLLTRYIDEVVQPLLIRENVVTAGTYCQWLQQWVYGNPFGTGSVISGLLAAEPSGQAPMPRLDRAANLAAFIGGNPNYLKLTTLQQRGLSSMIYGIRAAGLAVNYMSDPTVETFFRNVAVGVKDVWTTFFVAYEAQNPFQNPPYSQPQGVTGRSQLEYELADWLNRVLAGFDNAAATFWTQNAQPAIQAKQNSLTLPQNINVPMPCINQQYTLNQALTNVLNSFPTRRGWSF